MLADRRVSRRASGRACHRWQALAARLPSSLVVALVVLPLLGACGSSNLVKRTVVFQPQNPQTNAGRPFYALVRTVAEQDFLSDSYRKISDLVYPSNKKDESIVHVALIWPNRSKTVVIKVPKDKAVAIYCLFTHPGNQWKVLLPAPMAEKIWAVLDRGTIVVRTKADKDKARKRKKDDRADKVSGKN